MVTITFPTAGRLSGIFSHNGTIYSLKKSDEGAIINVYPPGSSDVLRNGWYLPVKTLGIVASQDLEAGYIEVAPTGPETHAILIDMARQKYGAKFLLETFSSSYTLPLMRLGEAKIFGYEMVNPEVMIDMQKR